MAFIEVMTAVVTNLVQCRQMLQCDGPLLMFDGLRAPFSQVNNGLDEVSLGCAGSAFHPEQRFHDRVEL